MSTPFDRMREEFQDKESRHEYANGFLNSKVATQLKVLREERGWTQQQLAEATGMQQARISVIEDIEYSSWSISTLRRYARAFDLRLDVEFKEFGTLPDDLNKFNRESLQRRSFDDDPVFHENVAASTDLVSMNRSIAVTYGAVADHQRDDRPLKLPAPGESFELNYPRPSLIVARDDTQNQNLLTPKPLREVS